MKCIPVIITCILLFSCGNSSTENTAGKSDTVTPVTPATPSVKPDTANVALMAIPNTRAIAMINHYKDKEVDPYRANARFANFNSDVLRLLFQNGSANAKFCFAAFLEDETRVEWRHHPTLIIQAMGGPQIAEPTYYLAEGICPPPSTCGVPFK